MLRHDGLACAECAVAISSSYQVVPSFLDVQTGGQLLGSNCCDSYFCIFILGYWGCQQQSVYFGLENFVCILQTSFVLDIE